MNLSRLWKKVVTLRGIAPRVLAFAGALLLAAGPLFADTRIKTVEYNIGGYYSNTNVNSNTQYNFTSRTIKLPENGKVIRSAWLHYEGLTTLSSNVNPLIIYFNQGAAASTARFTSAQYTVTSGESIKLFARADVTSAINAELANLASGVQFTAGVRMTGPTSNMHSIKLFVTYEYDDQSPLQVKTVRFPLYSSYASGIAAFTTQQAAGTRAMQYLVEIADTGYDLQQQWFEIHGFRQNAASDGTLYLNVNGSANEPSMNMDDGLGDSYGFRYLSNSTIVPGFSTGTVQTVNLVVGVNAVNTLSGEVVLTYIANANSPVKTKSAKTFVGQGLLANTNAVLSDPLYLREEGVTIKRAYARITGSYDSATAANMAVDSSVGGSAMPQRTYAIVSVAAQISGYQFFHDMTAAAIAGWTNGASVDATIYAAGGATGAHGMEMIVTYDYTNDAAHTNDFEVLAGNDSVGTVPSSTYKFGAWYPQVRGTKTLREAYVYADFIDNGTTQDANTTINFNGNSPETAYHRSIRESTMFNQFYQNVVQFSTFPAQVTANYAISSAAGVMGARAAINYSFIPYPKEPVSIAQKLPSGAVITPGQYINSSSVRFDGVLASSMNVDNIALVVEVKPNAAAFDEVGLSTGPVFNYNTVAASSHVVVSGLISGTIYHWRAAAYGDGGRGYWVNKGGSPDFGVDLSSPPAPALAVIVPAADANLNASPVVVDWEDVADIDGSGLKNYELQIATATDFTTITYSSSPLASMARPTALAQNPYYWRVRALDNAGNTGLYSATRFFRVDLSTPTATTNMSTGDQVWRNVNNGLYDVDFADAGGSLLKQVEVRVTSGPAQSGTEFAAWTPALTDVNSTAYSASWALPSGVWDLMQSWTTNYVSVRVTDYSSNTYVLSDAFKVFKDTVAPAFTNGEAGGDLVWRKAGRNYNVDFADPYSKLAGAVYAARTSAGGAGTVLFSTTALAGVTGTSYTTDWALNFTGLRGDATNYITVEFYDIAGNTTTITDAFKVLKDTTPPSYVNGEAGGGRFKANSAYLSFDWGDSSDGASGTLNYLLRLATSTDFTTITYSSQPLVSAAYIPLAAENTYYWHVASSDTAGNSSDFSGWLE